MFSFIFCLHSLERKDELACCPLALELSLFSPRSAHPPPQSVSWGWARAWEGTQLGQQTHSEQRDILYYTVVLSSKNWSSGRRWGGGGGRAVFDFQVAVGQRLA